MKESIIRTVVPIVYALLIRWGFKDYLGLDDALLLNAVTTAVTALVYAGIRYAEQHRQKFGWLLGLPKAPVYPN